MESSAYQVSAFWDEAAAVWVATSEDVPGLATEADTIEALSQKLRNIIPDLLLSNHIISADYAGPIAVQLTSHSARVDSGRLLDGYIANSRPQETAFASRLCL